MTTLSTKLRCIFLQLLGAGGQEIIASIFEVGLTICCMEYDTFVTLVHSQYRAENGMISLNVHLGLKPLYMNNSGAKFGVELFHSLFPECAGLVLVCGQGISATCID